MRRTRIPLLSLALAAILGSGCASAPTAGTGDVAFRLLWEGGSDLDLHVFDPYGEHLFYGHREAASGGRLDIDCNAGTGRLCPRPIENVFWSPGEAPEGEYRFWVRAYAMIPAEVPVEARLLVLEGETVVAERTAELRENGEVLGPFALEFTPGVGAGPVEPASRSEYGEPVRYRCEDGFELRLALRFGWARVRFDGRSVRLRSRHGFGGAQVSDDGTVELEWPAAEGAALVVDGVRHEGCRPVRIPEESTR